MAPPVSQQLVLTAQQAVALALLKHGFTEQTIQVRTDVTSDTLYPLAAAWNVTALCGTVEGHCCHTARAEDPCRPCAAARGRAHAGEPAQQHEPRAAGLHLQSGTSSRKTVTR